MKNLKKVPLAKNSKLSHSISFIRGDAPEYGVLKLIVVAKDRQAAIEHILGVYGEGTVIVDENK